MENRLLLKHLLEKLIIEHELEIRDKDNYRLFSCPSSSQVLEPFFNREVIEWFAFIGEERKVCILIGEENER